MNENLRQELIQCVREEQKLWLELIDRPEAEELWQRLQAMDQRHTARLQQILLQHGWPGKSLVGDDGANAVFLLVQHSPDPEFQQQCLTRLEQAVRQGEAEAQSLAYLTDRVRVVAGQPQLYGTQGQYRPDGKIEPAPIEDEATVDERRRSVGLEPLAEYFKQMNEFYKTPGQ